MRTLHISLISTLLGITLLVPHPAAAWSNYINCEGGAASRKPSSGRGGSVDGPFFIDEVLECAGGKRLGELQHGHHAG